MGRVFNISDHQRQLKWKLRVTWQNDMPPVDGSLMATYRWCSHLANAFGVALATVSL